jgi:raffinose/stachyose/melibiose transport system substrate-binding protein
MVRRKKQEIQKSMKQKLPKRNHRLLKRKYLTLVILVAFLVIAAILVSMVIDGINTVTDNQVLAEKNSDKTELQLNYAYQNPQWNAEIEAVIEAFEKKYPDIEISYEMNYEHKTYDALLAKKIARNELGDILQLKNPQPFADSGLITELPDELSDLVTYSYQKEGKTYALGMVEATSGIVYNKVVFRKYGLEEPENYQDFLKICKTLKAKGITPLGVAGGDLWHMEYWVNHFFRTDILAGDRNWLKKAEQGKKSWKDPEVTVMLKHLKQLFAEGYVNKDWRSTRDVSVSYMLIHQDVAMIYTGPWTIGSIHAIDKETELGWFQVPDKNGQVFAGDNQDTYLAVTDQCAKNSEKYDAAMKFIRFFYQKANYARLCRNVNVFPVTADGAAEKSKTAADTDSLRQRVKDSFDQADARISAYIGDEHTPQNFEGSCLESIQAYLQGKQDTEETQKQLQQIWKKAVQADSSNGR